jgi:ribosomal protein L28
MPRVKVEWAAPRGRMHRAFKGLYANRMIQFGNKVSFAENKSRRTWKPNVQVKSMYSEALGRMLRFRMTTHAMRCVRKAGGIDEYLVKAKESEIKYPRALGYKQEILDIRRSGKVTAKGPAKASDPAIEPAATGPVSATPPLSATTPAAFGYTGLASALSRRQVDRLLFTRHQIT